MLKRRTPKPILNPPVAFLRARCHGRVGVAFSVASEREGADCRVVEANRIVSQRAPTEGAVAITGGAIPKRIRSEGAVIRSFEVVRISVVEKKRLKASCRIVLTGRVRKQRLNSNGSIRPTLGIITKGICANSRVADARGSPVAVLKLPRCCVKGRRLQRLCCRNRWC